MPFYDRTEILLKKNSVEKLKESRICVFGLGGVGAAAAMDLVRIGVGNITVFDFDKVEESNLNRLYFGYRENLGKAKTQAFFDYAVAINPAVNIEIHNSLISGIDAINHIPLGCDYYLDCIDTLNSKVNLLAALARKDLPFVSSMGTSGRLAPELLRVSSLWESKGCPLARAVRSRLRRLGFDSKTAQNSGITGVYLYNDFLCVWSPEEPVQPLKSTALNNDGLNSNFRPRDIQGSGPFVPQAAGHILASLAVRVVLAI